MIRFGIGARYFVVFAAAMILWSPLSPAESRDQRSSEAQRLFAGPVERVVSEGPVRMVVEVDALAVRVAEPITLTIRVEAPRRAEVEIEPLGSHLGELEVISVKQWNALPGANGGDAETRRWIRRAQLESIRPGEFRVPPLETRYRLDPTSPWRSLSSEPLAVQVTSVVSEDLDPRNFRSLKPIVDVPTENVSQSEWREVVYAGVVAALAGIAIAGWWWVRRRTPDPAAVARGRIDQLARRAAETSGSGSEGDAVYLELEKIMRDFLASRFGIPAHSQATDELLRRLRGGGELAPEGLEKLESILVAADEIKYAPVTAPHGTSEEAVESARQVVDLATQGSPARGEPVREVA